jgi:WD40 repeat protein
VSIWDIEARHEVTTFAEGATAIAFDPSGRRLAAAGLGHAVVVWDLEAQEPLVELWGHDAVTCVAYHPHGRWLASAGEDRAVRLWDEARGEPVAVWELDTVVKALCFSPDGRWLYTGNGNTTCYRLDVQRQLGDPD